jgi:hypothetical protein
MDFERAIKIKNSIDKLRRIGHQLNQLVENKRLALERNDFNAAKYIKKEIDDMRH